MHHATTCAVIARWEAVAKMQESCGGRRGGMMTMNEPKLERAAMEVSLNIAELGIRYLS
jgi:hypothetical protein